VPAFAMLWGWVFLREAVTVRMMVGAAVVLLGTGLTTGLIRPRLIGWVWWLLIRLLPGGRRVRIGG
jgi:hypothetical protein